MSFTIGCDPELLCHREGKYVPAHNYYKSSSSFGLDGCESIAEVRPGFSESPIDLTAKIRTCLEYGHDKAPDLEFYAGHFQEDFSLGGHLHFSVQPEPEIVDALDTVLYSLSNCIDDKEQRQKRERTGYGRRKATRKKSYGFEYRTPGSWLLSPSTTLVNFTLAKLAVIGVQEDRIDFAQLRGNQHSQTFLRNLKNELKTIPDDCHEGLKELDMLLGKRLNWNTNILPNWGIN
ncbi:MAG: hypothetical protein HYV28_04970 [Ignavibacteriales bacterium]|nr:hypothetical protein [Ignavibacteriales bacterium]